MAGKDKKEIVVAGNGSIFVAPVGTTLPDDIEDALDGDFVELGFTTPDGAKFTVGKTTERVGVWQSFNPARIIVTEASAIAAFVLRQWSEDTVSLAFGGGEFSDTTNGQRYDPPDPEEVDERAMVIEVLDGLKKMRIVIQDGIVSESVEGNFNRLAASDLPITFAALATDEMTDKPWYLLGNDEFWNEAGS